MSKRQKNAVVSLSHIPLQSLLKMFAQKAISSLWDFLSWRGDTDRWDLKIILYCISFCGVKVCFLDIKSGISFKCLLRLEWSWEWVAHIGNPALGRLRNLRSALSTQRGQGPCAFLSLKRERLGGFNKFWEWGFCEVLLTNLMFCHKWLEFCGSFSPPPLFYLTLHSVMK